MIAAFHANRIAFTEAQFKLIADRYPQREALVADAAIMPLRHGARHGDQD